MSTVTVIRPELAHDADGDKFVQLCITAEPPVQTKTSPEYPDVIELDYSIITKDEPDKNWKKWHDLDSSIKRLMFALHTQFGRIVEQQKKAGNSEDCDMVVEKKGQGAIGDEQVFDLGRATTLYTAVFELVSNERLGRSSRALFNRYQTRCAFFAEHHVRNVTVTVADGPPLLRVLVATSKNFSTFLDIMNNIFMALDSSRTYSIHDMRPSIEQHGKEEYKKVVFDPPANESNSALKLRMLDSLLNLYRDARYKGADADLGLYTNVMTEVMGKIQSCYDVFEKEWQPILIRDIKAFYTSLGTYWRSGTAKEPAYEKFFPSWAGNGTVDLATYAELCKKSFAIEDDLQKRVHTRQSIHKAVERVMVESLIHDSVGPDQLFNQANISNLFDNEEWKTLETLYDHYKVNSEAMRILKDSVEKWCVTRGRAVLAEGEVHVEDTKKKLCKVLFKQPYEKLSDHNKRMVVEKCKSDCDKTIIALVDLFKSNTERISDTFNADHQFKNQAVGNAYKKTICLEKLAGEFQEELLPIYVNKIMAGTCKFHTTETASEEAISRLVLYAQNFTNKDVFMKHHRQLLAKRLLAYEAKPNVHLELFFLQKVSSQFGQAESKWAEGQIQDIQNKTEEQRKFDQWCKEADRKEMMDELPEMEITMLTQNSWPLENHMDKHQYCKLPQKVQELAMMFEKFYNENSKKRRIQWFPRFSLVTLQFKPSEDGKPYRIIAQSQQAAILTCFADYDEELTEDEIRDRTGICPPKADVHDKEYFERVFKSVQKGGKDAKTKSLIIKITSDVEGAEPKYKVNPDYAVNQRVVKLPEPYVANKLEKEEVRQDRSIAIQFQIVKLLKLHKTMNARKLVNDTLESCDKFKPNVRQVKECLEYVISKEWVRRDENDHESLIYVS